LKGVLPPFFVPCSLSLLDFNSDLNKKPDTLQIVNRVILGNVGRIVSDLFTPHTQNKIELGRRAVTHRKILYRLG